MALIRAKAPKAKIVFFTSIAVPLREKMHAALADYVAEQIKTCAKLGVPCLDLYGQGGITRENAEAFFGKDKLHLNEAGYAKVRDLQAAFLKRQIGR